VDADAVLDRIVDFFDKFESEMDDDFKEDLLDFMLDKVLLGHGEKRAKVIKALIPASPRRLKRAQEAGGTFMYRYADIIRTPKWLKKHALCGTCYSSFCRFFSSSFTMIHRGISNSLAFQNDFVCLVCEHSR
jgi:hypothetical protein